MGEPGSRAGSATIHAPSAGAEIPRGPERAGAPEQHLGWPQIVRLGLVQTALGSVVVLMTATLNRVMVVELALPAFVPGLLVALHYAVQVLRPRWGYGSDRSGRRTPWIVGGMARSASAGSGRPAAPRSPPRTSSWGWRWPQSRSCASGSGSAPPGPPCSSCWRAASRPPGAGRPPPSSG